MTEPNPIQPLKTGIDEVSIECLVRTFYGRAREDALIGPIFNLAVRDWEHHDERPMRPHLMLPLKGEHFDGWLLCSRARQTKSSAPTLPPVLSRAHAASQTASK
jgi:truncated hemoglobin YjbI